MRMGVKEKSKFGRSMQEERKRGRSNLLPSTDESSEGELSTIKKNAASIPQPAAVSSKSPSLPVSKNSQGSKRTIFENAEEESFWKISFEIDIVAVGLFVLAAATRFYNLTYPNNLTSCIMGNMQVCICDAFSFLILIPIGKQLIAASSYLFDRSYNGTFKFDRIGSPYPEWVPIFGMRFIPALLGSIMPSFSYILCREIGISLGFSILSGLLIIFDNALLIQSRYILMEMPLISFGLLGLIFAIKATKQLNSNKSLLFVSISAFFGTLSLSVKYIGSFYLAMSGLVIFYCFWSRVVPRKDFSAPQILLKMGTVYLIFFLTFFATYVSIFYVHLSVLIQAGPHDSVMTSAFQASLKGGLASIIKGQPIQYSDGRGSSHQQQVTCYSFKDVNNWWIVKRPDVDNLAVNETKDVIKHGDQIHLVHGMSGRLLNSHDVAAAQSPQNQEVSCYIDHNVSMAAEPSMASGNRRRLRDLSRKQRRLRMARCQINDRIVVQDDTVWNVEEHRYTKSEKDREKELMEAEMIPTKPTDLSFRSKFWELQWKMLISSGSSQSESHAYASFPSEWLFLSRGIAYWIGGSGSNAQIHLLGNPVIWLTASVGVLMHLAIVGFYLLRRRRLCFDIDEETWSSLLLQSSICLGGYGLTYIYHFCVDRTLFLHHYLPSYVFKIMLMVSTLHHLHSISKYSKLRYLFSALVLLWLAFVMYAFSRFLPTSVGFLHFQKVNWKL
ncbi:Protein O-mannosyltransferase 1 [Orchesella cincta]|uniref:dolichyl-phosphate-mannose--protein mannosyltransferase n=1 Tax=Orchesella cincta TaxID=48709 RepID=A0A1D2NI43_ORCCI|nr:Protein O-mannosyltransferase 1 [Orchesella cincta]